MHTLDQLLSMIQSDIIHEEPSELDSNPSIRGDSSNGSLDEGSHGSDDSNSEEDLGD